MADQLSKQSAAIHPLGASIPQLQRTVYHKSDGTPRDGSPSCVESAVDMEQYYQPLERFHGSGLHGWGIAAGLHVATSLNPVGVTVLPGIALDSNGLHILLVSGGQVDISPSTPGPNPPVSPGTLNPVAVNDAGVTVPTSGLTGEQYLVLQFGEKPLSDTPTLSTHTPWLHFIQPADLPHDGSCIPLAKATLDSTGKVLTLTQDMRQRADKHVERAQDISIHGPGVVVGLDVTATLNSAGVTVLPGVALDGNGQYLSLNSSGQAEVGPNADTQGATPTLANVGLTSGVTLATTGLTGDKYLTIQFWETPVKVGLPLPPLRDQVAPYRFVYTPWLRLVDPASVNNDPLRIILAKVTFGTGANGLVTNLTQDVRQSANLGIGGIHLLKSTTTLSSTNSEVVSTAEAGTILPLANGLAIAAPNANDEIHLNAAKVVTSNALTVTGATTTNGPLTANGNVTASGALTVSGPTTTNGPLTANGNVTASGALTVTGATTANGPLTANGGLTTNGLLTANGNVTAGGALTVNGPVATGGALTVNGEVAITNTPGVSTIVLNANTSTIEAGAVGTAGVVTVYDKTHNGTITLGGDTGKINAKAAIFTGSIWVNGQIITGDSVSIGTSLRVGDTLTVNGAIFKNGGGFRIDSPLDPEHKTLTHSFVESPDMKNIYDGLVTLDDKGEATVELPAWFTPLNSDVRYQLTCLGDYAPVYIAHKMQDNRFTIAGGKPNMEVSWQVTGIRQDTWAQANRFKVEEEKPQ